MRAAKTVIAISTVVAVMPMSSSAQSQSQYAEWMSICERQAKVSMAFHREIKSGKKPKLMTAMFGKTGVWEFRLKQILEEKALHFARRANSHLDAGRLTMADCMDNLLDHRDAAKSDADKNMQAEQAEYEAQRKAKSK